MLKRCGLVKQKIIIISAIVILIPVIIFSSVVVSRNNKIEEYKRNKGELSVSFLYTAHTGCCDTEDNSLASIAAGAQAGAGIVEFDLNFDNEENPVLCHDEPEGGEVSLKQAFVEVKKHKNLKVNVDAKSTKNLSAVQVEASKQGLLDRIFFTGITENDIDVVKMSCPAVDYYLNIEVEKPEKHTPEYLNSLVKKVRECGAVGINFNKDNASEELVEAFHENGLLVSIYTVDDEVEMYKILSYAPDNITTRNPDVLKEILKSY